MSQYAHLPEHDRDRLKAIEHIETFIYNTCLPSSLHSGLSYEEARPYIDQFTNLAVSIRNNDPLVSSETKQIVFEKMKALHSAVKDAYPEEGRKRGGKLKGKGLPHPLAKKLETAIELGNNAVKLIEQLEQAKSDSLASALASRYASTKEAFIDAYDKLETLLEKHEYDEDEEFDDEFRRLKYIRQHLDDIESSMKEEAHGSGVRRRKN